MIIERYLFRELLTTLLAVTAVLFLIFVSSWFARLLGQVASGNIPAEVIFLLLGLKSIDAMMVLLPLAFYLAVLLAFGRLYKDSEMTAMLACGVSLVRVTKLVFWVGVGFAVVVGTISLYFSPLARAERYTLQEKLDASQGLEVIAAGQFRTMAGGEAVVYVERLSDNGKWMENIFIQGARNDNTNLVVAERAYQRDDPESGGRYFVLLDGYRYEGVPGTGNFRIIKYREHEVLVKASEPALEVNAITAITSQALWESDKPWHKAELQWRISMPLSAVLLALLAVYLSRTNPRQGRYAKFFLGILVYVIYSNLMGVARTWVERGKVDPFIGIWWVHLLLLISIGILMIQYAGGVKRFMKPRVVQEQTT